MAGATEYIEAIAAALEAVGGIGGLFGSSQPYEGGSAIGRPEWWDQQRGLGQMRDQAMQFAGSITPEYMGHLQNAISGGMGMSPEVIQMMFGRQKQAMQPQFAMQQDALKSSFNPRLAGSGAAGGAMGRLLGGQGQQMNNAFTDINIGDLLGRFGTQQQALGQYGSLWSGAQGSQFAAQNAIKQWLG